MLRSLLRPPTNDPSLNMEDYENFQYMREMLEFVKSRDTDDDQFRVIITTFCSNIDNVLDQLRLMNVHWSLDRALARKFAAAQSNPPPGWTFMCWDHKAAKLLWR